ncbi:hypothetical protein SOVF_082020 [Spinacia oleracea]|nr:hypothetical protein SOVF_082020 [Spinacia oleracea]
MSEVESSLKPTASHPCYCRIITRVSIKPLFNRIPWKGKLDGGGLWRIEIEGGEGGGRRRGG